ncbi:malate synthase G (plasmid) [Sinorhizobium americanum]|uniref:Malate synthase G n=1 Tax=Sinorhizobium americanum TaxID=194963 RepID=A0A1L3LTJ8_9HYPH|nr:malate synthase G [Sinorhizobium americanum]OAP45533.1 hypothetical protein ATC00_24430 [Sinorhizobium americanum]
MKQAQRRGKPGQSRGELQAKLDAWYGEHGASVDIEVYQTFLDEIGYLPGGPDFSSSTANVDAEITTIAGPQLVVPVMNARYALNAADARGGSLTDARYGTDSIPDTDGAERGKGYNPARGAKVIARARGFRDASAPLVTGRWNEVAALALDGSTLSLTLRAVVGRGFANPAQFAGYSGTAAAPSEIVLRQNDVHIGIAVGYVVRWVDQGIGCSKVRRHQQCRPDGGPRDATHLSTAHGQLATSWHLSEAQIGETLERMAAIVDRQNADDPAYVPMASFFDETIAFQARWIWC